MCDWVLYMRQILNMRAVWIYQGCKCAGVLNVLLLVDMPGAGSDSTQTSRIILRDVLVDMYFGFIKSYSQESMY